MIVLPLGFFYPKMLVRIICPAINLSQIFSRRTVIIKTPQRRARFGVVTIFNSKSHTYNYSVNGQWALILPKLHEHGQSWDRGSSTYQAQNAVLIVLGVQLKKLCKNVNIYSCS
jgi:hypothetical protein